MNCLWNCIETMIDSKNIRYPNPWNFMSLEFVKIVLLFVKFENQQRTNKCIIC